MQNIRLAGGKGAGLSRLMGIAEINVPEGYIITTEAYHTIVSPIIAPYIQRLKESSVLNAAELSAEIKHAICDLILSPDFEMELKGVLKTMGADAVFAVRSSATAEDLPDASFAGQQDTLLNVQGYDNIKSAIIACFASLYNERAIAYRIKNQFDENDVSMAVVLQRMIPSQASGVLFTADPMSSDRHTVVIEAVEGLGEDFVSGRKTPVTWYFKNGELRQEGKAVPPLSEIQIKSLVDIGEKIGSVYNQPQDIEWCWVDNIFYVVQSRAITTLYPPPESKDGFKRCFISAGHIQMMTDAMRPLGISMMKPLAQFQTQEVGGRLYIDVTGDLKSVYGKMMLKQRLTNMDPLMWDAVKTILTRKEYIKSIPGAKSSFGSIPNIGVMLVNALRLSLKGDLSRINAYKARMEKNMSDFEQKLNALSGVAACECIANDHKALLGIIYDPVCFGAIMAVQTLSEKLNKTGKILTGEDNIVSNLSKSVKDNVTSEMGLALSDIADVIRESQAVIRYLENCGLDFRMEDLQELPGGEQAAKALTDFLDKYGMRCTGEIDITNLRFRENPSGLIAVILTNVRTLPAGHGKTVFDKGCAESQAAMRELIQKAKLQIGSGKAKKLERQLSFFRNFLGTREYPKYYWMRRYDIYKKAIMREAQKLTQNGCLRDASDVYYFYFDELVETMRSGQADYAVIEERREAYFKHAALAAPRQIFSDGEVVTGVYDKAIPENALGGLAVSGGVVEGRARVVENIEDANIEKGDILVTKFTDPSWTPVFVSIAGLVTEVGGMMTHGAVITREYGLPAVVGVVNVTRLIHDGDRIRINGNDGYVEIL